MFQFDVPVNAATQDATSLQVPDYFAIDQAQSAVIELTNKQFSICYGGHYIHCPLLPAPRLTEENTCLSAIYVGNKSAH